MKQNVVFWNRALVCIGLATVLMMVVTGCAKKIKTAEPVIEKDTELLKTSKVPEETISGSGGSALRSDLSSSAPRVKNRPDTTVENLSDTGGSSDGMRSDSVDDPSRSLGDIYFAYDKTTITGDGENIISTNVSVMETNKDIVVRIEGHCDARGTNQYNLALGDRRARAVKSYMVTLGVAEERIKIISFGEERPVCQELDEECWSKNRRAHFVITSQ